MDSKLTPLSLLLVSGFTLVVLSCTSQESSNHSALLNPPDSIIYTAYSQLENSYLNFHSPAAINALARMENHYFRNYEKGISPYYGTIWREQAEDQLLLDSISAYHSYVAELAQQPDSMHCTIYAVKALTAGMGDHFGQLETSHRRIWKKREHAGWSLGYLLVKEWNWKAYLVLEEYSEEYDHCQRAYQRNQSYPVWRQPDIPLEALYIKGQDDSLITNLLAQHEFGWGFSQQGIHTWITRFDQLKECIWLGAPGKKFEIWSAPLFRTTPFMEYRDYASHVLIFPPKKLENNSP